MTTVTATAVEIDAATLDRWLANGDGCCILDVRTPEEFELAHIPGSVNVPLGDLHHVADGLAGRPLETPLVLVCRSGRRAAQAHQTLTASGIDRLHVLDGGVLAWDDGARRVQRGRAPWAMDRQVRLVAGSLVLTGIVGSLFVPRMKFFAGAIGFGLTFSAVTNTCAMARVLGLLPYNRRPVADVSAAVGALVDRAA